MVPRLGAIKAERGETATPAMRRRGATAPGLASYRAYRTGTREAEGGIRDTPIGEVPLEFTKTP